MFQEAEAIRNINDVEVIMLGQMPRWKLFKFWGHPIYMEPIFLLLVAFFVFTGVQTLDGFMQGLVWIPVLFVGILWHEIGHALAIEKYGYGKSDIVLQGLGGVTINKRRGHASPERSIVISVAGPIFSLSLTLIFGVAAAVYPGDDILNYFFFMMALANGVWAVFNMLPIFPLDGGNVMLSLFRKFYDGNNRKAYLHTAYASLGVMAVGLLTGMAFKVLSPLWIVLLGFLFGVQNYQIIKQLKSQ